MNTNLTRVQVYLDPQDVSLLDQLASQINVTRSQIIRDATKVVADRYFEVTQLLNHQPRKTNPLQELIGIETSRTGNIKSIGCFDVAVCPSGSKN